MEAWKFREPNSPFISETSYHSIGEATLFSNHSNYISNALHGQTVTAVDHHRTLWQLRHRMKNTCLTKVSTFILPRQNVSCAEQMTFWGYST